MNNQAHTILVSVIASYGTRLTASTASCKAFLADYLPEYTEEKNVLIELHQLQLTKALSAFKGGAVNKKTLIEFIDQLETRSDIEVSDLAWGVDAWANAIDLDIKTRRMIRKQCYGNAVRDLHIVTIRPIEAPEITPEVPAVVIENANQAAFPRMAIMGVATLVSTFSIFQAVKSMISSDNAAAPVAIEQTAAPVAIPRVIATAATEQTTTPKTMTTHQVIAPIATEQSTMQEEAPTLITGPQPKLVVLDSPLIKPTAKIDNKQVAQHETILEERTKPINVEKLSGQFLAEQVGIETVEQSIDVAEVEATLIDPTAVEPTSLAPAENDKLHADIEAFLTQQQ